tara:strand:+ start:1352 stop:1624 length:273 start_codon:yes stop_codon:yes gene_type:complete
MSSQFLHEKVDIILEDRKKLSAYEMNNKYSKFAEECPTLWEKIMDENADLSILKTMLKELNKINDEKTFNDASQKMGFFLFDKFVKDQVS